MVNDVVVVVGVGGMGETIARRQGAGRQVVLADFNVETLERVAGVLRGEGYAVTARQVDVSDRASVAALADAAAALGPVTQVAHTAGLSPVQAPVEAILRVDLLGVAHALEEFGRVVAPGGAGVVIASMAGTMAMGQFPAEMEAALALTPADGLLSLPFLQPGAVPDPGAAYGIAKRANQVRVQAASLAWGARDARVNSISPGVISTPMGQQELAGESGAFMRAMVDASGTRRLGTPADIAAAAAFLLGPESTFVTGTDLLVDGGVIAALRSGALTLPGS
jgi:NAD(P)-dependent dehydrogenase (short-subunit alcohol dehydrogenase family)